MTNNSFDWVPMQEPFRCQLKYINCILLTMALLHCRTGRGKNCLKIVSFSENSSIQCAHYSGK